jgi:DNA-binding CsgD family transcriptional regulator
VFISGIEQESRGMIVASQGDHRQALRLYLGCGRLLGTNGLENPACSAWRSRAVVITMVGLGMAWEARTLGEAEVELARSWGAPGPLSRALAAAATTRELPQRLEMLHEAVGILDGTECVLDLARAQIRFGRAQLEGGELRVAELVIQGLGNQEVAVQLSISKRTVDTRLGRIYLHISGRNRLREALRGVAS